MSLLVASGPTAGADPLSLRTVIDTDKTVLGQPLALPHHEPRVIVTVLEIAPGASLPRHMHPFQRYAFVLDGELTVTFDGGKQFHYHAGNFIVEAVDTWHFGANPGKVPVRLLVIDQVEDSQSNTILAK